jgi:hypothetical protein
MSAGFRRFIPCCLLALASLAALPFFEKLCSEYPKDAALWEG